MYKTRRITQALLSIIVLAPLALAPQRAVRAAAVTRYVSPTGTDSADCSNSAAPCLTIQYALNQALADDTIEVAVGTYAVVTGTEVVLIDRNLTLSGGWDAGFVSQGGLSTIDGGYVRRGLRIPSGITASVDHLAIQNGFDNSWGGGILSYGSLTVSNSRVSHNVSEWMGGGIYSSGTLTIDNSTISDNTAGQGGSGGGGGAGIEVYGGTVVVTNTTISGNKIIGDFSGSAIDVLSGAVTLTLNNSTVSGNSGSTAIYGLGGNVRLNNSTVSANKAPHDTGGIIILGGSLTLNNSTVTANTTQDGAGGIARDAYYLGTVTVRNSILAGNTGAEGSPSDCGGRIVSGGYNLVGTNSGCTFKASTGDQVGTAASPIDPRLGWLRNNGGPTKTYALAGSSPALNAGNPALPGSSGNTCLGADQRGVDRVVEADCDIGAYEGHFPAVTSVKRASPSPTSAADVQFSVLFSDPVTGVNLAAPFNDFRLTTTGLTGAALSSASGSGAAYTVKVKTGTGNGTIRLDVVDDDSIKDADGEPLGQSGMGNGKFTTGEAYTIVKKPSPKSPSDTIWDRTPTYTWSKVPVATKYQYQLAKGTTTIYTKPLLSSACGTECSATPLTVLDPANYKWRARALASGIWQTWSPYLSFKLVAPKAGFWNADFAEFYVAPNRSQVLDFAFYTGYVYPCGSYKIAYTVPVAIDNGKFSFSSGGYYATGTFDSNYANSNSAHGTVGIHSFYLPYCRYITLGPYLWKAVWKNSNQPADAAGVSTEPIVVTTVRGGEPALPIPTPQEP